MSTDAKIELARAITPTGKAHQLHWRQFLLAPYPHLLGQPLTRLVIRSVLLTAGSRILRIEGFENVAEARDPFILVMNHTTTLESLLVPAVLMHLRKGRRVHFMADWNFMLIPPVAVIFRCGQVIPVASKPARPVFLNRFRRMFTGGIPSQERARQMLLSGRSIAIFPEGTRNPSRTQLLVGRPGATRLSIQTGVPVIPAGLVYASGGSASPVGPTEPFSLHIGAPMSPPAPKAAGIPGVTAQWHAEIMQAIGRLCGKTWSKDQ